MSGRILQDYGLCTNNPGNIPHRSGAHTKPTANPAAFIVNFIFPPVHTSSREPGRIPARFS